MGLQFLRTEAARLEEMLEQQKERTAGTTDEDRHEEKGSEDESD